MRLGKFLHTKSVISNKVHSTNQHRTLEIVTVGRYMYNSNQIFLSPNNKANIRVYVCVCGGGYLEEF